MSCAGKEESTDLFYSPVPRPKQHSIRKGAQGPVQHCFPKPEAPHIPHQAMFQSLQQSRSLLFPSWPKPSPFTICWRDANTGNIPEHAHQLSSSEGCPRVLGQSPAGSVMPRHVLLHLPPTGSELSASLLFRYRFILS